MQVLEIINEIVGKIVKNYQPEKVILFGSYASGTPNKDSDVDLLIIKDTDKPSYERNIEVMRLLEGCKIPFDILVYTNKELEKWKDVKSSFERHMLRTGKTLYARS